MRAGIGHNGGPDLARTGWRTHCWRQARRDLLPHMPLNVVRRRVRRAAELGLDYKTYATVRATTGRDIIGFLFSSNAVGVVRSGGSLSAAAHTKIAALTQVERTGLIPESWPEPDGPMTWSKAPRPFDTWAAARHLVTAARGKAPADGVLLVGAAPWEAGWTAAGSLAGYLDADRYFAAS